MLCRSRVLWAAGRLMSTNTTTVAVEKVGETANVGLIRLSAEKCGPQEVSQVLQTLHDIDNDSSLGCSIITGCDSIFSIGSPEDDVLFHDVFRSRELREISSFRKPVVACVNGVATGLGAELAIACDIVWACDTAIFSFDQILYGSICGYGGTQRLPRMAGKSFAMEYLLTGVPITALEAKKAGLVTNVLPSKKLLRETIRLGERLSSKSPLILAMAKECVAHGQEVSLKIGLLKEQRFFEMTFATYDKQEGMTAHLERRTPEWKGK